MGATPDFNRPSWNNPLDVDLDFVRDNQTYLLTLAAQCGPILPGWNTAVNVASNDNYQYPDGYLLSHANGRTITISLTWTDKTYSTSPVTTAKIITQMQLAYYDGVATTTTFSAVTLTVQEASAPPDATILWDTTPFTSSREGAGGIYNNIYFYETGYSSPVTESSCGYWISNVLAGYFPVIDITAGDFLVGEYVIKYEEVSGSTAVEINYSTGQAGVWFDLFRQNIELDDLTNNATPVQAVIDITIATDDGAGAPVIGTEKTKRVTFFSNRTS